MSFPKSLTAAASVAFVGFALFFYSWLAVAAPPPVEVTSMPAPAVETDFAPAVPAPLVTQPVVVPAPASRSDWEPYADQVFYALVLGLVGWVVKLVAPTVIKIGDWVGQRAAAEELIKDEKMNALSKALAVQALDFALGRLGYTRADLRDVRIRNSAGQIAAEFIHAQWPQVWAWVDQNKNGQIDWLESHNATQLPPVDHALTMKQSAPAAA